jgi:hypothetical protein
MKKLYIKTMFVGTMTAFALSGCGGGGSTPAILGAATTTTTSGTVAKSTAAGVTVNSVDFATSGATVTSNGDPVSSADLKPGMKVTITGHVEGTKGTASHIEHESELEGKVSAVDVVTGSFIIMGQTVVVTSQTVFDGVSGLASLNAGDEAEVDGNTNASGVIEATRVEVKHVQGMKGRFITGTIKNLDSAAKTFAIRNMTINFASATLPAQLLANGQVVQVNGALKEGIFVATKIMVSGSVTPTPTPNPTPAPLNGAALYSATCVGSGCHGALATSALKGRTATQIQAAISANRGGSMGGITLRHLFRLPHPRPRPHPHRRRHPRRRSLR